MLTEIHLQSACRVLSGLVLINILIDLQVHLFDCPNVVDDIVASIDDPFPEAISDVVSALDPILLGCLNKKLDRALVCLVLSSLVYKIQYYLRISHTLVVRLEILEHGVLGSSLVIKLSDEVLVVARLNRCHAAGSAQLLEVVL